MARDDDPISYWPEEFGSKEACLKYLLDGRKIKHTIPIVDDECELCQAGACNHVEHVLEDGSRIRVADYLQ